MSKPQDFKWSQSDLNSNSEHTASIASLASLYLAIRMLVDTGSQRGRCAKVVVAFGGGGARALQRRCPTTQLLKIARSQCLLKHGVGTASSSARYHVKCSERRRTCCEAV